MIVHPKSDGHTRSVYYRFLILALLLGQMTSPVPLLAQCTLVCNSNIQISLPETGEFTVGPALIAPTAANLCPGALELTIWSGPGQVIPDNLISCAQAGNVLTARVRHTVSGNLCNAQIIVKDLFQPQLNCPTRQVFCTQNTDPASVGYPEISDNCTPWYALNINHYDQEFNLPCGTTQSGVPVTARIQRNWTVSDQAGNINTCAEQIWIKSATVDSVVFPHNLDEFSYATLSCGQDPNDLSLTGQPLLHGLPVENGGWCEVGVTHTDQVINGCSPGAYIVLRTWLAFDYCTNQIRQQLQIIKVEDKTPPVLQVPADLTLSTDETECSGTVVLPQAQASDACSAVTVTPVWSYGSGYGPFVGVVSGDHVVTYIATDACGNTTSATMTLTVADDDPPQVICTTGLQVSLGSNGQTLVNTAALDGGSWDNCGVIFRAVSRDGINWAPTVAITCADEGVAVPVQLRVMDGSGYANFCEVPIIARDFLKPTLTCPPPVTLNCLQDPTDLALTGQAAATDNCQLGAITWQDLNNLGACHIGSIIRRWNVSDQAGNTRTCDQIITLSAVNTTAVSFPADVTLSGCGAEGELLPAQTGTPVTTGQSCFPLSVSYIDQVFPVSGLGCFVVLRHWKVSDQCVLNINGGAGLWEHVQQINVTDQTPPVLTTPSDITVSSGPSGCDAWVELPLATATDCSQDIAISHNGTYAPSGASATGWYPPGIHQITFTASDGCGNSTQKTLKITVADQLPPVVICLNGLSVNLASGGEVAIAPALFIANSSDNCTPTADLVYQITPQVFNCQQIGQQQVTLTATDAAGNVGQCQTYVLVQDNQEFCTVRHVLEGHIHTPAGLPLEGVRILDGQGHVVVTDTAGYYRFSDLLPGKDYTIQPELNTNWLEGVDAWDLVLISRHILSLEPLNTPEKLIAADANQSGTVTTFDIVQLRKVILGTLPSVPEGTSWRFVPADFIFVNLDNPFGPMFPETIQLPALEADHSGLDFKGIKCGSVD